MINSESKEELVQNLKDAGCGMETIQDFLFISGRKSERETTGTIGKAQETASGVTCTGKRRRFTVWTI